MWVANSGRVSLRWGPPRDTPREAREDGQAKVHAGEATLAFVVQFGGGVATPLPGSTYPGTAKRVIQHWLELCEAAAAWRPGR